MIPWLQCYHSYSVTIIPWLQCYLSYSVIMDTTLPWKQCYHGYCVTMVTVSPWCHYERVIPWLQFYGFTMVTVLKRYGGYSVTTLRWSQCYNIFLCTKTRATVKRYLQQYPRFTTQYKINLYKIDYNIQNRFYIL